MRPILDSASFPPSQSEAGTEGNEFRIRAPIARLRVREAGARQGGGKMKGSLAGDQAGDGSERVLHKYFGAKCHCPPLALPLCRMGAKSHTH